MTDLTAARPMLFLRVAFDKENPFLGWLRGDMGAWVRSVFEEEKAAILEDIAEVRRQEVPPKRLLADLTNEARWCVNLLADIERDMLMPTGERRMRIYRGGQALWAQSVLRDVQADLYTDLAELREKGIPEDDPESVEVRRQLEWSVALLRDVDGCLVSLVGPDEDPR